MTSTFDNRVTYNRYRRNSSYWIIKYRENREQPYRQLDDGFNRCGGRGLDWPTMTIARLKLFSLNFGKYLWADIIEVPDIIKQWYETPEDVAV